MQKTTPQVLYISYDGMTDPLGQSQVLPYLIGLSEKGYQFTLISCEKKARFANHHKTIENICQKANIEWHPLIYHKSPPILSTIWDVLSIQKLAYKLQEKNSFKVVHCRGYIPALVGLSMKRRFDTKFIFDMRGLWADEKVDAGAWNLNKFHYRKIYQFFKRKEKEFFLNADETISLTNAGKKEILSWDYMKLKTDNIHIIPCCVDTSLFKSPVKNSATNLTVSPNDTILSYLGSIGTWYMLDEMLDFFVEYQKVFDNAKFLFITQDEHDRIRTEAKKRNINDAVVIQPAQRSEVPDILAQSTHSIFFIRPTYSKISSSPTKQGEIMSMGIPIVCNAGVGDTDGIVSKYSAGEIIPSFNRDAYQSAIKKLAYTTYSKENIRQGAIDYFSLEKGIENYTRIYQSLC